MSKQNIHPTAVIEPGAVIGKNVTIEPYVIIKSNVVVEDNVTIKAHVYIDGHTTVGEGTVIFPSASIGTAPQDLKYKGEEAFVKIGKNCQIREFVTINSSSQGSSEVRIGDNCFLMAYCHVAHNCVLGNHVIMVNNATLAGHVTIEDRAIIGGFTPIPQFVRIGAYAMVGGMSRVPLDIPPYTIGGGIPFKFGGLNLIGLKRNGFDLHTRRVLSKVFILMYRSQLHPEVALKKIEEELDPLPEVKHWIQFCRDSKKGLMGLQGVTTAGEDFDLIEEEEEERTIAVS